MLTLDRFADRFGRKKSFYLAWIWLVVVSNRLNMQSLIFQGCVFLNTAKSPSVWVRARLLVHQTQSDVPLRPSPSFAMVQVSVSFSESSTFGWTEWI